MSNHPDQPYQGNILIADDGADSLRLLASILIGHGYTVSKAITSNHLLRSIKLEPPDLILLKTLIFGINGFELCQMLKSDQSTKPIPIIFISHADHEEDSVRAFEVGGADYITKPLRVREVLARIQNQLKILKLQKELQESNVKLQNDIIERQKVEERTRALIDAVPDIMFRHRIDGTYLDIKAREGVLLVPRDQLIGKKLQDGNIPSGTQQGLLQCIRRAIEKNEIQIYEHELQKSDGLHIYEARIVKSGADEAVCMVRDVTESKRAAEQLHLLDRAIAASSNGITISDVSQPDNPIVYVNPRFEEMTGYSQAEIVGRNCRFLQGNDTEQPAIAKIRAAVKQGEECAVILRNYRKDGTMFWNQLSISPVRDASGRLTNYIGILTDISDRKLAEEALQQAKEKAETANRAKSQFLANMSHELRTPLNAILGFTQIVAQDSSLDPEHQEHLGIISRSGKHLLQSINDVLEMAKVEAGKLSLNESSFNLHDLLDALAEIWQIRADAKGITLIFDHSNIPHYIYADEGKLRQVLLNLLGNAIKFTQTGKVMLRISMACEVKTSDQNKDQGSVAATNFISYSMPCLLYFEIEDTGFGIAPEELKILFEPFVQTEAGRRSQEGTGLGLSISRNFIRLMGGEISVTSRLGEGTIFNFYLPVILVKPSISYLSASPQLLRELLPSQTLLSAEALQAAITAMPSEWVAALYQAALLADANETLALIDCLTELDEPLAQTLRAMVYEFRFDVIFELASPLVANSPNRVT
jgi:PAS domain S-box-containing protein